MQTVRLGMTGIYGFAATLANRLIAAREKGAALELVAVTAPNLHEHASRVAELESRGVEMIDTYEAMLSRADIDAVWLPLPIDMHVPFALQAIDAGKAVMTEKPVCATVDECDQLITARDASGLAVAVGYPSIYDPATLEVKRRLLGGAIGEVRQASVIGCWPRGSVYYQRGNWPGRLWRGNRWVLDSPANNALAHYLNLALFWLGEDECLSADVTGVEAELYRAGLIENYDTCSMRAATGRADTASLMVLLTHACDQTTHPQITFIGSAGRLDWTVDGGALLHGDGHDPQVITARDSQYHMAHRLAELVRGVPNDDVAVATLEVARAQTLVINGASQASPIHPVPAEAVSTSTDQQCGSMHAIRNINAVFAEAAKRNVMLHQSGLVDWSVPSRCIDLRGYSHFAGPPSV